MAFTRECTLCGAKYEYCPHCSDFDKEPKWKTLFHDENCKKIFDTLQRHFLKELTDEEAIKILKTCDLSVTQNATETVKKDLANILSKEEKNTRAAYVGKRKKSNNEIN